MAGAGRFKRIDALPSPIPSTIMDAGKHQNGGARLHHPLRGLIEEVARLKRSATAESAG
jgi:hypothetical protein